MSGEQLKAFFDKVKLDVELQEKLNAAADANSVVAILNEAGFAVSADELRSLLLPASDDELKAVAGGLWGEWGPGGKSNRCDAKWINKSLEVTDYITDGIPPASQFKGFSLLMAKLFGHDNFVS